MHDVKKRIAEEKGHIANRGWTQSRTQSEGANEQLCENTTGWHRQNILGAEKRGHAMSPKREKRGGGRGAGGGQGTRQEGPGNSETDWALNDP